MAVENTGELKQRKQKKRTSKVVLGGTWAYHVGIFFKNVKQILELAAKQVQV